MAQADLAISTRYYFRNQSENKKLTDYRDVGSEYLINAFAANIHRYPGFRIEIQTSAMVNGVWLVAIEAERAYLNWLLDDL